VIGAAIDVHNKLGPGLKEEHYQKAMEQALMLTKLNCEPQKQIGVYFNRTLAGLLFIDLFVEGMVVVELKALSHLTTKNEMAQVITYLKAIGSDIGLLINFGRKYLEAGNIWNIRGYCRPKL
jgi:GxxExxY protein